MCMAGLRIITHWIKLIVLFSTIVYFLYCFNSFQGFLKFQTIASFQLFDLVFKLINFVFQVHFFAGQFFICSFRNFQLFLKVNNLGLQSIRGFLVFSLKTSRFYLVILQGPSFFDEFVYSIFSALKLFVCTAKLMLKFNYKILWFLSLTFKLGSFIFHHLQVRFKRLNSGLTRIQARFHERILAGWCGCQRRAYFA